MAQAVDIIAFDGASTPVTHTFVHEGTEKVGERLTMTWAERKAGVPLDAQIKIIGVKEKMKGSQGLYRLSLKVQVPSMETIGTQNAQGYTAAAKVAFLDQDEYVKWVHPRSTDASRRLSRQLLLNIAGQISTSVAPATTGQIVLFFDQLLGAT